MKQKGVKVYSKKLHNLFNAPTCLGCKLNHIQGATIVEGRYSVLYLLSKIHGNFFLSLHRAV